MPEGLSEPTVYTPPEASMEQARVFSRQHANGEMYSGTADQIGRVCTAMAGMSAAERNALLELNEVGTKILAEQQAAKPAVQDQPRRVFRKVEPKKPEEQSVVAQPKVESAHAEQVTERPVVSAANKVVEHPLVRQIVKERPAPVVVAVPAEKPLPPARFHPDAPESLPMPRPVRVGAPPAETVVEAAHIQIDQISGRIMPDEALSPVPPVERIVHMGPLADVLTGAAALQTRIDSEQVLLVPSHANAEAIDAEPEPVDLRAEADQLLRDLGVESVQPSAPEAAGTEPAIELPTVDALAETPTIPETLPAAEVPEPSPRQVAHAFAEALLGARSVAAPERPIATAYDALTSLSRESPAEAAPAEERPAPSPLLQEVAAHIEHIEPEQQQEAAQVMLAIAQTVQKIAELPPVAAEGTRTEAREQAERELEGLAEQLFDILGLDQADEAAIKRFALAVRHLRFVGLDPDQMSPESLVDVMHEFKTGPWDLFNPFATTFLGNLLNALAAGNLALHTTRAKHQAGVC